MGRETKEEEQEEEQEKSAVVKMVREYEKLKLLRCSTILCPMDICQ